MRLYIWKMNPTWRARHSRERAGGHVGDFIARDGNAAAGRNIEAAEEIQQRGLAGAAGAHERDEFAGLDIEIEALQDVDLFARAA